MSKNKVWLVNIDGYGISEHYYFGNSHFLFYDNTKAVKFIRNKAKKMDLQEVWIDVEMDENQKEVCTYLAFETIGKINDEKKEISVWFTLTEIR